MKNTPNITHIKNKKLEEEFKELRDIIYDLQHEKNSLEIRLLFVERELFKLNRKLDTIEEEILDNLEFSTDNERTTPK